MHDLDRITWQLDDLGTGDAPVPVHHGVETAVLRDATRLLELTTEAELELLLDEVVRSAATRSGRGLASTDRSAVAGLTKRGLWGLGRTVLPVAGRSFREWTRPGGAQLGAAEAARVGSLLGLPVEGLSTEDQEYEIAVAYVRFAHQAADRAFRLARSSPPEISVRRALRGARREHLPAAPTRSGQRRGAWRRHGRTIVVEGL